MYSLTDMIITAVLCLGIGGCIGIAISSMCVAAGESHRMDEWFDRESRYKELIYQRDMELREKSKFIARFRHKTIEIVQQYLQDNVAACTMIVASIRGIKEKDEISG